MEIFLFILCIVLLVFSVYQAVYLMFPLVIYFLYSEYPQTQTAQIVLLVIWLLLLFTTRRMQGAGQPEDYPALAFPRVVFAAISLAIVVSLFNYWDNITGGIGTKVLVYLFFSAILYFVAVVPIAHYIIAPLFCRRKTVIEAKLEWYSQFTRGSHRGIAIVHFIRFEGDPIQYQIDVLSYYRKYRNKIGVPFSYEKCECPFGFVYIRRVKPLSDAPGKDWEGDSLARQEAEKKSIRVALIAIGVAMGCLVAGFLLFLAFIYAMQSR